MIRQFRLLAFFCLGILIGGYSVASFAAFTSYQGSAFRNINGTMYWKGDAGTFAASKARVIESVNVGGKYVGVPHVGDVGAAAITMAITGLRMTPKGIALSLAAGAFADWLTSQGYTFGLDSLETPAAPIPETTYSPCPDGPGKYAENLSCSWAGQPSQLFTVPPDTLCPGGSVSDGAFRFDGVNWTGLCRSTIANPSPCPAGYTSVGNGMCSSGDPVPMSEADWTELRNKMDTQLTDAAKADMCRQAAVFDVTKPGCAMANPKVETTTVPLSDWVQDSTTGKWSRTVAKVVGAPTAEDPYRKQVDIQVETQDRPTTTNEQGQTVDAETGEVIPTPAKTTEQEKDFCTLHPDALACWEQGEPEDLDLGGNTKNITITPDSGWGASGATCPADLTYTTHGGIQVKYSWQPLCQMANTFRPIVIGFAWLSSILIFLGISRRAT